MHAPTRCYPHGDLTPLLCAAKNALSPIPAISAVATRQLLEHLRPRVRREATTLVAGRWGPCVSLDLHVEHALSAVTASLATCSAVTDLAFYAWASSITTAAVLEELMADAAYQRQRRRRAMRRRASAEITQENVAC